MLYQCYCLFCCFNHIRAIWKDSEHLLDGLGYLTYAIWLDWVTTCARNRINWLWEKNWKVSWIDVLMEEKSAPCRKIHNCFNLRARSLKKHWEMNFTRISLRNMVIMIFGAVKEYPWPAVEWQSKQNSPHGTSNPNEGNLENCQVKLWSCRTSQKIEPFLPKCTHIPVSKWLRGHMEALLLDLCICSSSQ